ncbi:GMC oxidoreductase [Paenibacillus alkaliterrae]|uniref:GMC oxidoreductase n=1 Tax=Paenibacillus alkaliterrae TaxID=320909 RepID=UPI001F45C7B2|nr:GMC oxidoreductase [Paenibacillus alkaliterrae]MCF2939395.1 GMC oxidoreductase [Paenibacillus alkaliterrae]
MRIYIAKYGETLRNIAQRQNVALEELVPLNPQVASPDANLSGRQIKLPPPSASAGNRITDFKNEWIPLTPLTRMAQTDYDVLIVGSGAGGGAVLWRLCQQWGINGKKIGVVEAGDLLLPTHFYNIPTMSHPRAGRYFEKVSTPVDQTMFRELYAFGGRTLLWGLLAPRMPAFETADWPLPANELQFYYSIAERAMNVTPFYQKGSYFTSILLDRLHNYGFIDAIPFPVAVDQEATKYGQIHSNAAFSSIALFAEALNRRPFDLAVNSRAVEIITENKRVAGIRVMSADKKSHVLKAKTVVLAASTFQTPRLLLASGITGRAIGHYLTTHSLLGIAGYLDRKQFPEVLGNLGIVIPAREDRPFQLGIDGPPQGYNAYQQYQIEPLQEQLRIVPGAFGAVESQFENRVELDSAVRDEFGVPVIHVHFSYSKKDEEVIRQMKEGTLQLLSAVQAHPGEGGTFEVGPAVEAIHDSGTCRMGNDPDTSATDRYGQIHGISGLYVADNSVIPSSGTANPTLTTVALAIRTADYLIRQLK